MDNETIAKDLVAAYLTKNKLPTPKDVALVSRVGYFSVLDCAGYSKSKTFLQK
jgi:hypothetical protein